MAGELAATANIALGFFRTGPDSIVMAVLVGANALAISAVVAYFLLANDD